MVSLIFESGVSVPVPTATERSAGAGASRGGGGVVDGRASGVADATATLP